MLLDAICISSHLPLLFYQQHRCWLDCTQHFHIFFKYSLDGPYYLWEEEATFLVTNNGNSTVNNIREKEGHEKQEPSSFSSFFEGIDGSVRVDVASKEKLLLLRSPSF